MGIFKNDFLGGPFLSKGIAGQDRQVGWTALTHNLWLLADLRKLSGPPPKANGEGSRPERARGKGGGLGEVCLAGRGEEIRRIGSRMSAIQHLDVGLFEGGGFEK